MSSKLPYFPWYPKDCDVDEDVRMMNDAEFGFYVRCLNHSWINDGLPVGVEEISRCMGRTLRYTERIWRRVGRCFLLQYGRLRNPRQELERVKAEIKSTARAGAANVRWDKQNECKVDANGMQLHPVCNAIKDPDPDAYLKPDPKPNPKPNPKPKHARRLARVNGFDPAYESWFETVFWPKYWRKTAHSEGKKALAKHATSEEARARILAVMLAQKPGYERRDTEKRPYLSTWSNQERFNDEPEVFENGTDRKLSHEEERDRIFMSLVEDHIDDKDKQKRLR